MNKVTLIAAAAAVSLLTACGGGGDDSVVTPPPTPTSTAEGFWVGTASTGNTVALAILENGETWGVYSRSGVLQGALFGNTTSTSSTFSGTGLDFGSTGLTAGTYSGSYSPKATLNATTSAGGTFTASYSTAYEQPASLAALAGTYSGYVATKSASARDTVTVSSTGAIRSGSSATCLSSGTASPRASGKNVFNVSVTFSGPSCLLGSGTTVTGVAYLEGRQLITLTLNGGKTDGLIFLGSK